MRRNIKQLVTILDVMLVVLLWLTACGKSTEKQIAEQLELGNKYLTDGDYEQAIVAFNKVIELDPKMMEAYTGLVESFYGKEDYDFLLGIYAFVGVYALAYTIFSIVLAILHIHLSNAIDWIASIVLSILSIVYVVRLYIKREESKEQVKKLNGKEIEDRRIK